MERADRNIDELLEQLRGNFHRLRQSGIDEELFDVISGFEAASTMAGRKPRAAPRSQIGAPGGTTGSGRSFTEPGSAR
jgi:hypothetical protein